MQLYKYTKPLFGCGCIVLFIWTSCYNRKKNEWCTIQITNAKGPVSVCYKQKFHVKVFYHDNHHKHKAKLTSEWLENKTFEWMNVLQWFTRSCDLSPADNLWHYLKTACEAGTCPRRPQYINIQQKISISKLFMQTFLAKLRFSAGQMLTEHDHDTCVNFKTDFWFNLTFYGLVSQTGLGDRSIKTFK